MAISVCHSHKLSKALNLHLSGTNLQAALSALSCASNTKSNLLLFRHNDDRFSKFAFGMDKYKAEDMTGHDITKDQDYASFMAIHANNQGNGSEGALKRFNEIVVKGRRETASDKLWSAFCSGVKP